MIKRKGNKVRLKFGDVFEIPLPDGRYAYGRIYDDAGVGIYRQISSQAGNPPIGSRDFRFHVGMYDQPIKKGQFKIVGYDPFSEDESSWPPPSCIIDPISGAYSIYHMGEIRKATKEECEGLEETAVWDIENHIIPRIMNELNNFTASSI